MSSSEIGVLVAVVMEVLIAGISSSRKSTLNMVESRTFFDYTLIKD